MRSDRLKDLMRILRGGRATSQQEIVAALREAGHEITQATVSRDLQEIGAVKVRSGETLEYRLPDEVPRTPGSELMGRNLFRTLRDFVLEIRPAGSLLVVVTAPGHASAVARAIDLAAVDSVVGTVAGDDTIFVATPGPAGAQELAGDWMTHVRAEQAAGRYEGEGVR